MGKPVGATVKGGPPPDADAEWAVVQAGKKPGL